MMKSLHCGLCSRHAKGALWHLWNVLRVTKQQWVQIRALSRVTGRALHCGVGYLCFLGVFPFEQKYQCSNQCRPGTEGALPVGGCMDWIFKSNTSSSRKVVPTWLCSHGVFKQESVFIWQLSLSCSSTFNYLFFSKTCPCLSGSTHFYMLVCDQALPEVFKDSICVVIYVSTFWRQCLHFYFLSHKENYIDSKIIKWTATSMSCIGTQIWLFWCFIRILHLICGQCQMWDDNFSLPSFRC